MSESVSFAGRVGRASGCTCGRKSKYPPAAISRHTNTSSTTNVVRRRKRERGEGWETVLSSSSRLLIVSFMQRSLLLLTCDSDLLEALACSLFAHRASESQESQWR